MKKLLLCLLSAVLITGCSVKKEEYDIIEPATRESVSLFDEAGTEKIVSFYNDESTINNFTMIGTTLPNLVLERYNGDTVNPSEVKGKVVVEYVANWCGYCQQQEKENIDNVVEVLNKNGITFFQMFVEGDNEEVSTFMQEAEKDPSRNNPILGNEDLYNYAKETGIPGFPCLVFYDETGKASWAHVGLTEGSEVEKILEVAFDDPLYNHFETETATRTIDDVKKDLGEEFVEKVKSLSDTVPMEYNAYMNMGFPIHVTGKINTLEVGKTLDFDALSDTTAFVFLLATEDEEIKTTNAFYIQTMNLWAQKNPNVDIVYLLVALEGTPRSYYESLSEKPLGYVVDANGEDLPTDMYNIQLFDAPSLVFYSHKDEVLTGGYIGEISVDKFEEAYQLFKEAYKLKRE